MMPSYRGFSAWLIVLPIMVAFTWGVIEDAEGRTGFAMIILIAINLVCLVWGLLRGACYGEKMDDEGVIALVAALMAPGLFFSPVILLGVLLLKLQLDLDPKRRPS